MRSRCAWLLSASRSSTGDSGTTVAKARWIASWASGSPSAISSAFASRVSNSRRRASDAICRSCAALFAPSRMAWFFATRATPHSSGAANTIATPATISARTRPSASGAAASAIRTASRLVSATSEIPPTVEPRGAALHVLPGRLPVLLGDQHVRMFTHEYPDPNPVGPRAPVDPGLATGGPPG